MEAGFRQRLLTGTMLAGGALFGVGGAPTLAEAASCTTIVDNTGSMVRWPAQSPRIVPA
jgi:hypothetical protein